MSFQVAVIDTSCDSTDQTFFPPSVALSGVATTTIGRMVGFNEYAPFTSNPPKKYLRLTWTGTSEQTLFNGVQQIAGAKYDWDGSTVLDNHGNATIPSDCVFAPGGINVAVQQGPNGLKLLS